MAYPGTARQRKLGNDAKRVRDELGKGQEVLRKFGPMKVTIINGVVRSLVGVPDVDIRIVDVRVIGEGVAGLDAIDLADPAAYSDAPAAANRLMTALTAAADDTIIYGVLTGRANKVQAEQPIILMVDGNGSAAGTVEVEVSYVLADDVVGNNIRTYGTYG